MRKFKDDRLYARGRIIWCRVPGPTGVERHTTGCTDETAAILIADEFERRHASPSYAAARKATIEGCVEDFLQDQKRRGRSEATLEFNAGKLGHCMRLWGKSRLEESPPRAPLVMADIDGGLLLEYLDTRQKEGVGNYTIKREVEHIARVLKLARFLGKYDRDLAEVIPPNIEGSYTPKKRRPTFDEFLRLLAEFPPHRAAHLAYIVATGARAAESFRAMRKDVSFELLQVHLHGTKTAASDDDVPITPLTETCLRFALEHAPDGEVLFEPWGNNWRDLQAACVRANIAPLSFNDLRRAFGTWHAKAGVSLQLVSKMLRHENDDLVQSTYADLEAEETGALIRHELARGPKAEALALAHSAKIAVPDLYAARTKKGQKSTQQPDPVSTNSAVLSSVYRGAGHGARTRDLRLGKPITDRIQRGGIIGRIRAHRPAAVPILYAVPAWVREATLTLYELQDRSEAQRVGRSAWLHEGAEALAALAGAMVQ